MAAAAPSVHRRAGLTPARLSTLTQWAASLLVLGMADGAIPVFARIVAGYAALLWALGAWLLPEVIPVEADAVLRAAGSRTRLAARGAVVVAAVAFAFTYTNAFAGLQTGTEIPVLTPWIKSLRAVRLAPYLGGIEWFNFAAYALVPGTTLLALGARPRELGLRWPARQTVVGTQAAPWRSLAEDLALNVPVALAFGYLAVRSRSRLLPTCLHMLRWLP